MPICHQIIVPRYNGSATTKIRMQRQIAAHRRESDLENFAISTAASAKNGTESGIRVGRGARR